MTEREIEGLPHVHRQREADQTGPMWIGESVVHPQGHPTPLTCPTDQRPNIVRIDNQMAIDGRRPAHRRRRCRGLGGRLWHLRCRSPARRKALYEAAELHLGKKPVKTRTIGLPHFQCLEVQLDL